MDNAPVILYVEDEESDVLLLRLALKRSGLPCLLRLAVDGVEAIDYLAGTGPFADRSQNPLPCAVLLDLKLPRKSGFEVLEWIRRQPALAALPVVIYTSSTSDADRDRARELCALDYTVKMSDVNAIAEWLRRIGRLCQSTADRRPGSR